MAKNTPEVHIEIRDLTMAYGTFVIQRELNFNINRGDVFVIMGGSGCGKSTLLKHMLGLISPVTGDILYEGKVSPMPPRNSRTRCASAGASPTSPAGFSAP